MAHVRLHILTRLFLLAAVLFGSTAAAETQDARFLDGLRRRGMFPLAESYCQRQLARDDLSPSDRAELVIELSRCYTQHAVQTPPDPTKRDPLWQRALQVTEEFARTHRTHPRLLLVSTQGALSLVVRGELARQEAEVLPDSARRLEIARIQLLRAVVRLKEIEADVAEQSTRPPRPNQLAAGALDRWELLSLQGNINYQLARALRNQAFCYPAGSADRANSLNQALARLGPVAEAVDVNNLVWRARLDQIVCLRLQEKYATATRRMDELTEQQPPAWVKLRRQAERIRVVLAQGGLSRAIVLAEAGHQIDGQTSAELDFAHIETHLAAAGAARKAGRKDDAQRWQQQAEAQVRRIESRHGPYWTRRADTLLGRLIGRSGGSLRSLAKLAERFYHGGQIDQAVAAYDRAWRQAAADSDTSEQFRLARTAAAIEQQRRNLSEARDRYRALATSLRTHPDAAKVHLQAIYLAAQIARAGNEDARKVYAALIDEHLRNWSDSPTAGEANWRLGWQRAAQRDWRGAIEAFKRLAADHPRYARAVADTARCYRQWIKATKAAGRPSEPLARRAAQYFEQVITGPSGQLPEQWSKAARQAGLTAAGLWLYETGGGYRQAEQVLTAALAGSPGAPAEWTSKVQSLLVFSLAGQGKQAEAKQALRKISAGDPGELLDLLTGLSGIASGSDKMMRSQLAALQLDALNLLKPRRGALTESQQRQLAQIEAAALAAAGEDQAAHDAYEKLSEKYPNDAAVQESQAQFLVSSDKPRWLKEARAKWHTIERRTKPASARWFRAKYAQALANERLGDKQQAVKIIKLLQVLHPELGGPEMKDKFQALLKRSQ